MENTVLLEIFVSEKSSELAGKPMHHRQIQRSKILVEWEIRQVVVDVEEESILVILRWLRVRNPKQFIYSEVKHERLVIMYGRV